MRWMLESWQPPRPQTGETGHLRLPEGDRPMPVAFHKMLGLVSSDAGFRALDEVWLKLCRGSTTPPRGLHQDGLLRTGKVSGSLSPPKSHRSVLSKSALPEQLLQNCTRISIQEKTHQGHGPKRQARFSGLGGSLAAAASRSR